MSGQPTYIPLIQPASAEFCQICSRHQGSTHGCVQWVQRGASASEKHLKDLIETVMSNSPCIWSIKSKTCLQESVQQKCVYDQRGELQCMHMQVRELIYRELLEYHPHMLADYLSGNRQQPSFMYPSAVDNFKRQFAHLEGGGAYGGAAAGGAPSQC